MVTGLSAEHITYLLFQAGKSLHGKNLRKSSWLAIAEFVRFHGPLQQVVWARLRTATTREDILKALRLVRKQLRNKSVASSASSKEKRGHTVQAEQSMEQRSEQVGSWCDRSNSYCAVCGCFDCQRTGEGEGDDDDLWWFSTDTFLTQTLLPRPPLFSAASAIQDIVSQCSETQIQTLDRTNPSAVPIEERLAEYIGHFGNISCDICSLLEGHICNARFISDGFHVSEDNSLGTNAAKLAMLFSPFWIRPPNSWNRLGATSLLDHLFAFYDVPRFLYDAWLHYDKTLRTQDNLKWLIWFILLGQGGSLKRASVRFGWKITNGLQQRLTQAPPDTSPVVACIFAEVTRLGGSEVDFRRIIRNPAFVVDPTATYTESYVDESYSNFWEDTVRWLGRHRDAFSDEQSDLILAWAMHEYTERRNAARLNSFSWKRRGLRSVLEQSIE